VSAVQDKINEGLIGATGVAWDGCHKIYILMNDEAWSNQSSYGYDQNTEFGGSRLFLVSDVNAAQMLESWWHYSCGLRFITAITSCTHHHIIPQGWDDPDYPEDTEDL